MAQIETPHQRRLGLAGRDVASRAVTQGRARRDAGCRGPGAVPR
jgi:hypothetical protein